MEVHVFVSVLFMCPVLLPQEQITQTNSHESSDFQQGRKVPPPNGYITPIHPRGLYGKSPQDTTKLNNF